MSKLYNKYKQPTEGETGTTKKMGKERYTRERRRAITRIKEHLKSKEIKRGNRGSGKTKMRST